MTGWKVDIFLSDILSLIKKFDEVKTKKYLRGGELCGWLYGFFGMLYVHLYFWRDFNQLPSSTKILIRQEESVVNTSLNDV